MQKLGIGSVWIPSDTNEKIIAYQNCSGKSLIQVAADFVVGRLSRDRTYYYNLALNDAICRGLSFRDYGKIILDSGYGELPKRREPQSLTLNDRPLGNVFLPNDDLVEVNLARIPLGNFNYVCFVNALDYESHSKRAYVALILFDHIQRRWSERFAFQIDMENIDNW